MKVSCIYTITNILDGKIYVGYSSNYKHRIENHLSSLSLSKHTNEHLQRAVNKYGIENFQIEILEECEEKFLTALEHYWCNILNTHNDKYGYNIKPTHPDNKSGVSSSRIHKKGIIQYGVNGKKIAEFNSIKEATNITKIHHISASCKGKRVSAGGYLWRYSTENLNIIENPPRVIKNLTKEEVKEVRRLRKEGKTYRELSILFNISPRSISDIIRNVFHKLNE